MIIVYKVLLKDNRSAFRPLHEGGMVYPIGEKVEFEGGWGALAFVSLEYAKKWQKYMMFIPGYSTVWAAAAELMALPPMSHSVTQSNIDQLREDLNGISPPSGITGISIGSWPPGTVMCQEITLLKEVE